MFFNRLEYIWLYWINTWRSYVFICYCTFSRGKHYLSGQTAVARRGRHFSASLSFTWRKMAERSCGGCIGWAAGGLKRDRRAHGHRGRGRGVGGPPLNEPGQVNQNRLLFLPPRKEKLELNEEPRKRVGHERGKFAVGAPDGVRHRLGEQLNRRVYLWSRLITWLSVSVLDGE